MDKNIYELAIEKATNVLKFFTEKSSQKFESVKIVDSDQLVEYSELVVGADVSVSTSDGSVPASDGNIKLVNGAEIVLKSGKISEIVKEADSVVEDEKPADEAIKMSGDLLKLDWLEIGQSAKIQNEDGEKVAEDGVYQLELTVADGKIAGISTLKSDATTPAPAEDVTMAEDATVADPTVKALEEKVSKLEEAVKAILEAVSLQPSQEEVKEFNSKVEKLSKLPTQVSVDNRVEIQDSVLEKYTKLAEKYTK